MAAVNTPLRLNQAELQAAQQALPLWQLAADGLSLQRRFRFADFNEAFGFMTRMALVSEAMNHHPEWHNVYDRVQVTLSTHDAGGITALDIAWARRADMLASAVP